jgi:hypothetical protein
VVHCALSRIRSIFTRTRERVFQLFQTDFIPSIWVSAGCLVGARQYFPFNLLGGYWLSVVFSL